MSLTDYSIRYADNWRRISYQAKQMTGWKCCLCEGKATETHHALYKDKGGAIAGREKPGVHIFPLCNQCHDIAHNDHNWRRNRRNRALENKNTPIFYQRLRDGWLNKKRK